MATINANMSSSQNWVPMAEGAAEALVPGFYTLDAENIQIGGAHHRHPATPWNSPVNGRYCQRGVAGSTKASHTSGATLTRYYPDAPGGTGGGVTGGGSPTGSLTPSSIGSLYVDTTNGSLYIAHGATSADWTVVGGIAANAGDVPGVSLQGAHAFVLGGLDAATPLNGSGATLSDAYAQWNGNGDGLTWEGNGTDGEQYLLVTTGGGAHQGTLQDKDGVLHSPGGIIFPSSDPLIAGAWWDNNGVLTKSAGPPP